MFLVELVMQGVRGFRELARLRFQSGFNLVVAGNESGKTTAVDSMERLLFPSNQAVLLDALVSKHTPDASRGALVVCSDDGAYYRIIQDFSKRAVNLSKYNTTSKDFTLMHKEWDSAVSFMGGLASGISEEDFSKVFLYRHGQDAARTEADVPASAPAPQVQQSRSGAPAGGKAAANQEKLAALREALRKAEESADAEYRAQAAKLSLEGIKKKLAVLDEGEEKKAEIESSLEALKACAGMPENLSELINEQERRQSQKLVEDDERNGQIEGLRSQLAGLPTPSLTKDKLFISGATTGIVVSLLGMFVLTAELAFLFPVGLVLAFGMMATAWYNGSQKNVQRNNIQKEIAGLEKELVDLERRFQHDGATITAWMKSVGAESPAELKDKAGNYRYFLSLKQDMEEQRQRIIGETPPDVLRDEYASLEQETQDLEEAARAVAQNNVDTYALRQDIERLEGESATGSPWDFGSLGAEPPADAAIPATGGRQAGFHEELGIASRIGGIEMETLVPAVEAAAQRHLSAITNGRYVRIEAGQTGDPIVHAKDDSVASYGELSHGTRTLIYFCLRTGLVEAIAGKRRLPFILDDPLAEFDPARQKAACQILRNLGTKTQVILFTSNPALKAEGEAAAELK